MKTFCLLTLLLVSSVVAAENNANIPISFFSAGSLVEWENQSFSGDTYYRLVSLDNTQVLKAESQAGASGLLKKQVIDLQKTPYLNWRWRIDNRLAKMNEQSKAGDDYSARIYVVIDAGWAFWQTKAINYVWVNNTAKGFIWPNAFAGKNVQMMAIRSSQDKTHTWYQEKRNIRQDLKALFGTDILHLDAIAIMTDTDNAEGNAVAYYSNIYFSSK